jgi:hypothetical protein
MITPDNPYFAQVQLLVRALPIVATERCFALKGGTAINLFVRDLPRLSVDIDLAYLPINDRATALEEVDAALRNIKAKLEAPPISCQVQLGRPEGGRIVRLFVRQKNTGIKIEVTPVMRGTVYTPTPRRVMPDAEALFGFAEVLSLSLEDLYAGKLVAALDRQHPRDLFDVKLLLKSEGINERLFQAFLIYLISHDRPIVEVLFPPRKPLEQLYADQFVGLTAESVSLVELASVREKMIAALHARIDGRTKEFLLSFKRGSPDWKLHPIDHAAELPAVQWKLMNLDRMDVEKRTAAHSRLSAALGSIP